MNYLIDTNVVSELMRREPHPSLVKWAEKQTEFFLSVITVEEIEYGLAWHPAPSKSLWFRTFINRHCRILAVTREIAVLAGQLRGRFSSEGENRTQADLLIAATARLHGLAVATRNMRDFSGCGLNLLNPMA